MAKREVLGVMDCPECGMSGAEVKLQKTGLLYRWCPECNAQYFPRTPEASDRLAKAAGMNRDDRPEPVTVTVPDVPAHPAPAPARKRASFDMGL
jgi:hypothetical protein